MKTQHTPGPWFVSQTGHEINTGMNGSNVALLCVPGCTMTGTKEANARLIAAAPELLEALERIECAIAEGCNSEGDYMRELAKKARAAIAKAKGQG